MITHPNFPDVIRPILMSYLP